MWCIFLYWFQIYVEHYYSPTYVRAIAIFQSDFFIWILCFCYVYTNHKGMYTGCQYQDHYNTVKFKAHMCCCCLYNGCVVTLTLDGKYTTKRYCLSASWGDITAIWYRAV